MRNHIFVCEPGWEVAAGKEIAVEFDSIDVSSVGPGWLTCTTNDDTERATQSIALSRQCLPHAIAIQAKSIREWVDRITPIVVQLLADHHGPWAFHIFSVPTPGGTAGPRRCSLIRDGLLESLKRRQKRLLKTLDSDGSLSTDCSLALVQIGLVEAEHGFISALLPNDRPKWRRIVSRFVGGRVDIAEDKQAPSRAFLKLREALARMGDQIRPGENCVDLGSSPGGWAYVAVKAGANVIAVDRSELSPELMRDSRVQFVRGDAFKFRPEIACDWLLSDLIAFPERIIELLDRWLCERHCRKFVVTVKFRGSADYDKLQTLKRLLENRTVDFELRRLDNNKNEVTAFGRL